MPELAEKTGAHSQLELGGQATSMGRMASDISGLQMPCTPLCFSVLNFLMNAHISHPTTTITCVMFSPKQPLAVALGGLHEFEDTVHPGIMAFMLFLLCGATLGFLISQSSHRCLVVRLSCPCHSQPSTRDLSGAKSCSRYCNKYLVLCVTICYPVGKGIILGSQGSILGKEVN